jgi:hypothetical protein
MSVSNASTSGPSPWSCEVKVLNAIPTYEDRVGERHYKITAENTGDRPIVVTAAGFQLPDGRRASMTHFPFGDRLPRQLAPGGTCHLYQPTAALEAAGADVADPMVAFVSTANEEDFTSKPTQLM